MIAGSALRTPLVPLNLPESGSRIYLKLENLQSIGSFKIRGAANAMGHIPPEQLAKGVVTASAGNMAQGVAWRARELGIACTIIAPDTAPETKVRAVERLGGKVLKVPFDDWWRAFENRCHPGAEGTFIHAFDDPYVMAGNGTIGLEILEDLPDVDAIVIPWGGGGLSCGIATAVRAIRPECRLMPPRSRPQPRFRPRSPPEDPSLSNTSLRLSTESEVRASSRECSKWLGSC